MTPFDPISSLTGGALIGLAAGLLLIVNGRVAGISGILGSALAPGRGARGWRLAFLLGLPLGAGLVGATSTGLTLEIGASPTVLVVAGLLVGFGTRLGSGCTSGHGVCGVSRGAPRSIAATLVFLFVAGVTVFVVRHGLGATA